MAVTEYFRNSFYVLIVVCIPYLASSVLFPPALFPEDELVFTSAPHLQDTASLRLSRSQSAS